MEKIAWGMMRDRSGVQSPAFAASLITVTP